MALITCPECGAQVSDAAASCIKCGCTPTKTKICFECKASIAENAPVCPNCGHPQNLVRIRVVDDKRARERFIRGELEQWQVFTGRFKKNVLAKGKGFNTVEFSAEEPVQISFRHNPPLWTPYYFDNRAIAYPGKNYRIYADGGIYWAFEEDT